MDVYNDAFWRWKELKCQSGCFSAPPGGPPRELWLWEIGVGMGRDCRGNGQLQQNVTFIEVLASFPHIWTGPGPWAWPSWLDLPRAASSSQRGQLTGQAWSYIVQTGPTAGGRLIHHLDSWERRSSAFVAVPPLSKYSKLFTPCRPFLSSSTLFMPSHFFHGAGEGGLLREPLSKQWRKEAAIFTLFPGEPAFLFFYLSSKLSNWAQSLMSESWINSFKPKGAGHPSPNRPWNVLLEIIKAFPRQHRQILGNQKPPALLSLLYWWFKVSQTKRSCLTWCHLLIWWIMSRWFCSFQRGSGTRKKPKILSLNTPKIKVYFII